MVSTLPMPEATRGTDSRSIVGSAVPRSSVIGVGGTGEFVSFPLFGPWGRWYPWCTSGFGSGFGFVTYDPWRYGATRWYWGRYGMWYDPWSYYWDPMWSTSGAIYSSDRTPRPKPTSGSLRIKANLAEAKVYIDGALVGTVDEFDGLNDHLEIEGGKRVIELKAEGYQDWREEVSVSVGKTRTVRANLKKVK